MNKTTRESQYRNVINHRGSLHKILTNCTQFKHGIFRYLTDKGKNLTFQAKTLRRISACFVQVVKDGLI